jgi:predicted N-formylglutamate amidohydrolase
VPARWRPLFRGAERLLASHRGYDPGALEVARRLARATGARLHAARATRLLVDLNRSPGHRRLFSERTRGLERGEKERLLAELYLPYRSAVEREVRRAIEAGGRVLHLSVHSFTPVLDGDVRRADVGLLYDPARPAERAFAGTWSRGLCERAPELRVRRNYPYRGVDDGLIPWLRERFPARRYAGLELELNQRHAAGPPDAWRRFGEVLVGTFLGALARR